MSKDKKFLIIITFSLMATVGLPGTAIHKVLGDTSGFSNKTGLSSTLKISDISLVTKILAKNLENHLQKAAAILNITSKLPQVRNVSFAHLLNQTLTTLHGIPQGADIEKRQVGKDILASNSDLFEILFIMPNGDIYVSEPYSEQQSYDITNLAFRDYFQGAIKTNDLYLGNVITSATVSAAKGAGIAVPSYSLENNSTITGVWVGAFGFNVLNKDLQSLNITSVGDNIRVVYLDSNGQKAADSDVNKSKIGESFATLNSFKNAKSGQSNSTMDTVNNTKMLVTYQPVKVFHNTWVVLLMQPLQQQQ